MRLSASPQLLCVTLNAPLIRVHIDRDGHGLFVISP